ncbi:MAG: hypothetical protein J6O73_07535 [Lachnospiraceae bacterium]|nr:hypothetical protein [Lachnospiraceae bacterium]
MKQFKKYLLNEFQPAQIWAESQVGRSFIAKHIPSLDALRPRENDVLARVYEIIINGKSIYIGQSLRTIRRLYVHAHHLAYAPEIYFGIKAEEIQTIEFRLITPPVFDEKARLGAEEALVKARKPVLQPYHSIPGMRGDACLPRGQARREAMIQSGAIQ